MMIAQTGLLENMAPHGGFMPAYKIQMLSLFFTYNFFWANLRCTVYQN